MRDNDLSTTILKNRPVFLKLTFIENLILNFDWKNLSDRPGLIFFTDLIVNSQPKKFKISNAVDFHLAFKIGINFQLACSQYRLVDLLYLIMFRMCKLQP